MSETNSDLLDLISGIYDCALKPDNWPEIFARIAVGSDTVAAALSVHDPVVNKARFSATWNVPPDSMERYNQVYAAINPLMTSGWFCAIDDPVSAAMYCGPDDYFSSRFCREFIEPLGWGDAIGSHLMKSTNRYSIFAAFASRAKGVIGADKLAYVRTLSPHIRRAVTISDLLDARELREDMLASALDLLTVGIVLTDEKGRMAHLNRAAREFLGSSSALRQDGDFIVARDSSSAAELTTAISLAAGGHSVDMPASGIAVPLRGISGSDLAAWVLPLDGGQRKQWGAPLSARVAIFLRELGDTKPFQGEIFVKRYGITPAECQVLMLLLRGLTVNDICASLDRRETTIKTHLSNLFAKTGTTSQVDLVRLALSVVAPATLSHS